MITAWSGNVGYLELVVGPMYSGKTSHLLNLHRQFNLCDVSNTLVNHSLVCGESLTVANHDDRKSESMQGKSMYGILPIGSSIFERTKVFLVNEAQFFSDICSWSREAVSPPHNKLVYLAGLDGDYRREEFGDWFKKEEAQM